MQVAPGLTAAEAERLINEVEIIKVMVRMEIFFISSRNLVN